MKKNTKQLIATMTLLFLHYLTNAQSTQSGIGAIGHLNGGGVATYYVGWNAASTIPLNIEHRGNLATQPINFLTNGIQRMTISNGTGPTAGFVGIGLTAPLYPLDVKDRINITNNNALGFGYFINGFDVLQVPGTENTFVGKGAGASANMTPPPPFVQENTFVGFQEGGSTVNGDRNT